MYEYTLYLWNTFISISIYIYIYRYREIYSMNSSLNYAHTICCDLQTVLSFRTLLSLPFICYFHTLSSFISLFSLFFSLSSSFSHLFLSSSLSLPFIYYFLTLRTFHWYVAIHLSVRTAARTLPCIYTPYIHTALTHRTYYVYRACFRWTQWRTCC